MDRMPTHGKAHGPLSLLLLLGVLSLTMGVRDCERVDVGDDTCTGDDCDGQHGGAGDGDGDTAVVCDYGGDVYAPGDDFPSEDGCNECSCGQDGQVACTERACAPVCGGIAGLACGKSQYCHYGDDAACGAADQTGICEALPEQCTEEYEPVCGCDGETHGNRCQAAAAGTSVASEGACGADPEGCDYGGQHHAVGDSFDAADGCNTCTCSAGGAVACTERACPQSTCGGFAGIACAAGHYCEYPAGSCNFADHTGVCKPREGACDRPEAVCGCDGQDYDDACIAGLAGVTVDHVGACRSGVDNSVCGGILGVLCQGDLYCDYPTEAMCGVADQQGRCHAKAEFCTDHIEEVCGCDGVTYSNPCEAATVGMSVSATGPCP